MPEWERWEISRARTREKYELRDIVPNVLILTGSSLCQRTVSAPLLLDREAGSLRLLERPRYPPTQESGLSHIRRSRQGETNLSSLCEEFNTSIQHIRRALRRSGPVQQNFSTATQSSNPAPRHHPSLTESRLLVNNRIQKRGAEDGQSSLASAAPESSRVARNVRRFPRKFLLLQEDREGNQESFDTFQAVGVRERRC